MDMGQNLPLGQGAPESAVTALTAMSAHVPTGEHHRLRGVRPVQLIPDHNACHTLSGYSSPSARGKGGR